MTGEELIALAWLRSKSSEGSILRHVLSDAQSTHREEVSESIYASIKKLYELYNAQFNDKKIYEQILTEIGAFAATKGAAYQTAFEGIRAHQDPLTSYQPVDKNKQLSVKDALVLVWLGIGDSQAMIDFELSLEDIALRKEFFIKKLLELTQHSICIVGTFNEVVSILDHLHKCVQILFDVEAAKLLAQNELLDLVKACLKKQPEEKQQAILSAWEYEDNHPAYQEVKIFHESAKSKVIEILKRKYGKSLTEKYLRDLIEVIPYLGKNKLVEAQTVSTEVSQPSTSSLASSATSSASAAASEYTAVDTRATDEALLKKPTIFRPFSNTLLYAMQDISGNSVFVKELLCLVSTEAVIKAVMKRDCFSQNALICAAGNQTTGGFTTLIEKLATSEKGIDTLCQALLQVNRDGNNALICAATNQTTGGFVALIEKLVPSEKGIDTLCQALLQVNRFGENALICAAAKQTTGGFVALIEKLATSEKGIDTLCQAMLQVNNFDENNALMFIAEIQTTGEFVALIEKLVSSEKGIDTLCQAMLQVNRFGNNALIIAAAKQTTGGFVALIKKLATSEKGIDAICKAMLQVNSIGNNALILAAENQTTGGFTTLIEKLMTRPKTQTFLRKSIRETLASGNEEFKRQLTEALWNSAALSEQADKLYEEEISRAHQHFAQFSVFGSLPDAHKNLEIEMTEFRGGIYSEGSRNSKA